MVDAHSNSWNSLEKDSLKKSLNSQSSLASCFSLTPQGVSQLNKWARDLSWMRWSINTPHQVQGPATRIPQKTSAPDAFDVAPDALRRGSDATLMASCTCKSSSHQMLQRSSGVSLRLRPVRNWFATLCG